MKSHLLSVIRRQVLSLNKVAAAGLFLLVATPALFGWGNEGHQYINHVAVLALPADVPAFLRTPEAVNEITWLGPEPDRWRSRAEPELSTEQAPEHFIDFETADLVGPLPRNRYDFIRALAKAQVAYPDKAADLTVEKVGLQPYITNEVYERLKAAFREYRSEKTLGQDTKPVEQSILFYAGWLGHYAADGSQPLHTTIQYNGWVGPNPNGYTTAKNIHYQFETAFVLANIKPADFSSLVSQPHVMNDVFTEYVAYLRHTQSLVEKVYQLDKVGGFTGAGTAESRAFTEERLAAGASMLRDLMYSAWVHSADPVPAYTPPAK
jgi:hypothetical protein